MPTVRSLIARSPIDPYLLLLIGTVGLAILLPARGTAQPLAESAVTVAVGLLFFLYGARCRPQRSGRGFRIGDCNRWCSPAPS